MLTDRNSYRNRDSIAKMPRRNVQDISEKGDAVQTALNDAGKIYFDLVTIPMVCHLVILNRSYPSHGKEIQGSIFQQLTARLV